MLKYFIKASYKILTLYVCHSGNKNFNLVSGFLSDEGFTVRVDSYIIYGASYTLPRAYKERGHATHSTAN